MSVSPGSKVIGILGAIFVAASVSRGVVFTFSNTNSIAILDSFAPPTKASLYPSPISVTGLDGHVITKATATLHGLTHTFPSDIYVLLVGPQNQKAILMADVGGTTWGSSVTNITLTLDDDAPMSLPVYTTLSSGVFKATNGDITFGHPGIPFDFPAPAPAGNWNSTSLFSVFKGADPTGDWNLFVVDNASGDVGCIEGGWTLELTLGIPLEVKPSSEAIVVSWPETATNCVLQSCSNPLESENWSNVLTVPVVRDGMFVVTNTVSAGTGFFRLMEN